MDPISILSLIETCAGLAVTSGKLAIGLRNLAGSYKQASLTFRSLSCQCKLFGCALRAIQQWMEDGLDSNELDESVWEQLTDSLECARDTIVALQDELVKTSGGSVNTFWEKVNVLWNHNSLKSLEDCIQKQVNSLSVILQIMNLPTGHRQKERLAKEGSVFSASKHSAMSLYDPGTSTTRLNDTASGFPASTKLTRSSRLRGFDFDDVLMTSPVYLRACDMELAIRTTTPRKLSTHDAGVSANAWDLPPPTIDSIDLAPLRDFVASYSKLSKKIRTQLLPQHQLARR